MFIDINESKWSQKTLDAIEYVTSAGIMRGYEDGSFRPSDTVTNAELCKILYEIIATDPQETPLFSKTYLTSHWASEYVNFVLNEISVVSSIKQKKLNKLSVSKWADEEVTKQSLWIMNDFLSLYSSYRLCSFSLLTSKASRLDVSKWIFDFFNRVWVEQSNTDKWDRMLCEWGKKCHNNHHLKSDFFFWKKKENLQKYKQCFDLLSSISHLITASKGDEVIAQYKCLKELPSKIKEIQNSPQFEVTEIEKAYHYTGLASLYAMLKHSRYGNSNSIYLHLNNVAYLNDPAEGSILLEELSGKESSYAKNSIQTSHTFIASLISSPEELLPMWVQYADNAKGCRIEFTLNQKQIKEIKRVIYVSPDHNSSVKDLIDQINSVFPQKSQSLVNYLKQHLDKIRFLFKSSYYQHESEIRLVDNVKPENAKLLTDPDYIQSEEDIPRLYVNSENPLWIRSVMLGPKCPNPEKVALYLHNQGIKNVQRSSIEFR